MKYLKQMKRLTEQFDRDVLEETTIAELAEMLECSDRHAKTVVGYLDEMDFIDWKYERGRGKKPKIKLNVTFDEIQLEEAKQLVQSEKYQEAFKAMEKLHPAAKDEFQQYMEDFLGVIENTSAKKDVLRYPFYETRLRMDPLKITSRHDSHMVQQIFDCLVEFDPVKNIVIPKIAHYFESVGGKRWVFYLRKGVFFHHGRELTSKDVKATFSRMAEGSALIDAIHSIHCISKYVVEFQLEAVDYLFPRELARIQASIIPFDTVQQEDFVHFPIGSGPFQMVRDDEEMVRLDAFEKYYGFRPWLDSVEILKTPAHFKLNKHHPIQLSAPDLEWKQVAKLEEGADFIIFNHNKAGVLQDESFREIVYEIIDPQIYCLPGEKVSNSFLTERKKQHLEKVRIRPSLDYSGNAIYIAAQEIREEVNHLREAEILKKQLQAYGIPAKIEIVDINYFKQKKMIEKFDLFVGGIALGEDRLLSVMSALYSNRVPIYDCMPEKIQLYVVECLQKTRNTEIEEERWAYYFEVEEMLKDHHILHFLNHRTHTVYELADSPYKNIELDSNGRIDYRKVWKKVTLSRD